MGTSKGYGGPPNGLVPSWLLPSGGNAGDSDHGNGDGEGGGNSSDGAGDGTAPSSDGTGGFSGARTAFTRFSKTGTSSSLGAAMAGYVNGGGGGGRGAGRSSGGARRAMQRMGASLEAGGRLLGLVRDFQQIGPTDTLRRLELADMVDKPAADVFIAVLEFLCPPGGAIDEAISRQAMLEAIGNLDQTSATEFGALTPDQLREFFLDFVVLSIEGRIIADIGAKGLVMSADIETVESAHTQLHEFIEGCSRVHLSGLLTGLEVLSNREINQRIDEVYEAAFSLIAEAGEDSQ